jgi:DNA topoisomerase-1
MELAVKLLSIPRELGEHPETSKAIVASIGPYGPYVKHGDDFTSLKDFEADVYSVTFDEAVEIIVEDQ